MSFVNQPQIVAEEVSMFVVAGIVAGQPRRVLKDVGYNFCPASKTWYEEEVDTDTTRTLRFSRRSDHTGLLIQIDKAGFNSCIDDLT